MLHDRALLVTLSLSKFEPKRTDKRITRQVLSDHGAAAGTLRVAKKLLPDEAIEPINKLHSETREYHYRHTLAWGEQGERLLNSQFFMEYAAAMAAFREKADALSDTFAAHYDDYVATARTSLNGAFDPSDYPAQRLIREKFRFKLEYSPVPAAGDFRISVMEEAMENLRQSVDIRIADATRSARTEAARRLAEPLAAMVQRLSDPDAVFRDSLVTNLREMADLLPVLNVTADPELDSVRQRILTDLYQADPGLLRENRTVRASTARKAQSILDTMNGFFAPAAS